MAQNPTLKGKDAVKIYLTAFPDIQVLETRHKATQSGHVVTALLGDKTVDTVLVRYDGVIFRNHVQVYSGDNNE